MPSSEILIAIPNKKGLMKYTTYLGLVDSGSSGTLVNTEIVQFSDFDMTKQRKYCNRNTGNRWPNTYYRLLLTSVRQKKAYYYFFPHVKKRSKDKYDFILGRDLLKDLGLDIQYSASQFIWNDIIVTMVPSGHWTKEKISGIATS